MNKSVRLFLMVNLFTFTIAKAQQPNIVWIVSEDNSKHYMKLFDEHGVATPNVEGLAKDGIVFDRAFSNAAVCSAARSTLILSTYGPKMATHYHRAEGKVTLVNGQDMFPAYLRKAGYYTANNAKEDYNINKPDDVWDDSSKKASWTNRKSGQPFFYVYNIETTHEGRLHFTKEQMNSTKTITDPTSVFVQPNHPKTDIFRYSNAYYRDKIVQMDKEVGEVIEKLKKDGLYDNTIIFYYGDHGGILPASKGYLYETGLHVPLVVHVPEKYKNLSPLAQGTRTNSFVSFVDFGATVLNLAGIEVPKVMDGKPFLGKNTTTKTLDKKDETFGYADRFDEKYDMVRSVRKDNIKYIRNFEPFNVNGLMNAYRYKQLAYQEWEALYKQGKLNKDQSRFFEVKPAEELYDVIKDPYELNNLAALPDHQSDLKKMRKELNCWMESMPDLSFYPEFYLIENAIQNPLEFGKKHKKNIRNYIKIANLEVLDFEKASPKIKKLLQSEDKWERYWALIVATSFGDEAKTLTTAVQTSLALETENINKLRAAEFLSIVAHQNTAQDITAILYAAKSDTEALLILNAAVLLKDYYQKMPFAIDRTKIDKKVITNKLVEQRLDYIKK
ncbi:sulfatase [Flavobacterium sp. 7A]|uniref:sulfatase family protein n=1 Tax=Flavobacterium sp. 7A TaxID=2940571 RepID=UPI00222601BD|nr:sulfatase [Flavobacterium sp. 7A]MCW2119925.1 arylsulfatase A-like enzyme [Flavobacterium sp. 7A]